MLTQCGFQMEWQRCRYRDDLVITDGEPSTGELAAAVTKWERLSDVKDGMES
jgi:hypothetical protein